MGVFGTIICTILLMVSFYIIFFMIPAKFFTYILHANIVMAVLSMLLLTGLASNVCNNEDCRMGPGGYLAIFDFFLWLGVAYITRKLKGVGEDLESNPNDEGDAPNPSLSRNQPPEVKMIMNG